ncbi:MAG: hypothetical protein RJA57_287 [Bacteroidota bacterium]|jgi:hypothetical protein
MKKTLLLAALCSALLLGETALANTGTPANSEKPAKNPARKNKAKKTGFAPLINTAVKVYPDAFRREMHVIARKNDGKDINFFVFDMDGNLANNFTLEPKSHRCVKGLERGTYIYRIFQGDEETVVGKFEIR